MKRHYFDHDYTARNDQKILQLRFKHGAEGYGLYWMLLETMAEDGTGYINRGAIGGLSVSYGVAIAPLLEVIETCVEVGLFKVCEHGNYYSERMLKHKAAMLAFSEFGQKGAEIRRKNRVGNSPPISPPNTGGNTNEIRVDEIKGDEIKGKDNKPEESTRKGSGERRTHRFINPSIDEIKAYCADRGNAIDAEAFYNHYESNGWMVGKVPMKSWKATIITWEKNHSRFGVAQKRYGRESVDPAEAYKRAMKATEAKDGATDIFGFNVNAANNVRQTT